MLINLRNTKQSGNEFSIHVFT